MGKSCLDRKSLSTAKQVADVLRSRSKTADAYTLMAPDGRLYCEITRPLSHVALRDCYVFSDKEMAAQFQRMEKGSKIVPVRITLEITVGKD